MISCPVERVEEIKLNNETLIGAVRYAPILSCITVGVFSLGCIVVAFASGERSFWPLLAIGLFCGTMAFSVWKTLEDRPTISVYETFLILFDADNPTMVSKVLFDDIEEWNIVPNSNSVRFLFKDGREKFKDTFVAGSAYRYLMKGMPEKEKSERKRIKDRDNPLRFNNPFKK